MKYCSTTRTPTTKVLEGRLSCFSRDACARAARNLSRWRCSGSTLFWPLPPGSHPLLLSLSSPSSLQLTTRGPAWRSPATLFHACVSTRLSHTRTTPTFSAAPMPTPQIATTSTVSPFKKRPRAQSPGARRARQRESTPRAPPLRRRRFRRAQARRRPRNRHRRLPPRQRSRRRPSLRPPRAAARCESRLPRSLPPSQHAAAPGASCARKSQKRRLSARTRWAVARRPHRRRRPPSASVQMRCPCPHCRRPRQGRPSRSMSLAVTASRPSAARLCRCGAGTSASLWRGCLASAL